MCMECNNRSKKNSVLNMGAKYVMSDNLLRNTNKTIEINNSNINTQIVVTPNILSPEEISNILKR